MFNAKSLLDNLTGGQGVQGLTEKARQTWDGQSNLGKGAIAGGLLGLLFTGGGRRLLGTGAKVGASALIGGLAYQAYQDWKKGKDPAAPAQAALPSPEGTVFLPTDLAAANDLAGRVLQAMVSAAKADGHVTPDERSRIDEALQKMGLEAEAEALIKAELDAPVDVRRIAGLARGPEEAAEIYAASLLVVDEQSLEEKGYLAMLAAALNLEDGLVQHLHAKAASVG
ncbi:tellurite resistance TerB family protein [Rhodobacter sp. Har01]|uniref:tellurite resistance TerB family protein n=1 Tax=Rhodobacter sp. Har01 TaxID=2883999 RepID=UPI001D0643F5|nr:tellurite resistance TerB family protein [Rhodobacter sp. Har01]MCB6179611.1 tellurite resistance TerB family protein [Rhodobacter sp. Har01]